MGSCLRGCDYRDGAGDNEPVAFLPRLLVIRLELILRYAILRLDNRHRLSHLRDLGWRSDDEIQR